MLNKMNQQTIWLGLGLVALIAVIADVALTALLTGERSWRPAQKSQQP